MLHPDYFIQDNTHPHIFIIRTHCERQAAVLCLARYKAIRTLCTGNGRLPAEAVLLEAWDPSSNDWSLFQLKDAIHNQEGVRRLIVRIVGVRNALSLGREITLLEEDPAAQRVL